MSGEIRIQKGTGVIQVKDGGSWDDCKSLATDNSDVVSATISAGLAIQEELVGVQKETEEVQERIKKVEEGIKELTQHIKRQAKSKPVFVSYEDGVLKIGRSWTHNADWTPDRIAGVIRKVEGGVLLECDDSDIDCLLSADIPHDMKINEYRKIIFLRDPVDKKKELEWKEERKKLLAMKKALQEKETMEKKAAKEKAYKEALQAAKERKEKQESDKLVGQLSLIFVLLCILGFFYYLGAFNELVSARNSQKETTVQKVIPRTNKEKVQIKSQKVKQIPVKKAERQEEVVVGTPRWTFGSKENNPTQESLDNLVQNAIESKDQTIEIPAVWGGGKVVTVAFPKDRKYVWQAECITDAQFSNRGKKGLFNCEKGERSGWMPPQKEWLVIHPSLGTAKTVMKITVKYL